MKGLTALDVWMMGWHFPVYDIRALSDQCRLANRLCSLPVIRDS